MKNNIVPVSEILEKDFGDATQSELIDVWNATSSFLEAIGNTLPELLEFKHQMDNEGKGSSNKYVCAKYTINHWELIAFLRSVGYITDENKLTTKGLLEMNGIDEGTDTLPKDFRPVLYDKNGNGLYWDMSSKYFKPMIARIKLNTKKIYNADFKDSDNPTICIQHLLDELNMELV